MFTTHIGIVFKDRDVNETPPFNTKLYCVEIINIANPQLLGSVSQKDSSDGN